VHSSLQTWDPGRSTTLTVVPFALPFGRKAPASETEGRNFDTSRTSRRNLSYALMAREDQLGTILTALRGLAPPDVDVGARTIGEFPMFEVEREEVKGAAPHRRLEFASGRALLRDLIGVDVPIPAGSNRAPVLPPGVCGSLAHDGHFVVAAVGNCRDYRSIGVDIEPVFPLDQETARAILRRDETDLDPHLAFTLKEATYKAWSGAGGRMLEHHEVRVSTLESRFRAEVMTAGTTLHGAFTTAGGRWLALVTVENEGAFRTDRPPDVGPFQASSHDTTAAVDSSERSPWLPERGE
jgi:enterobactin synthetase component D